METTNKTLSDLVNENPRAAEIFESYGLDFCCRGNQTLETACIADPAKADEVRQRLEALPADPQQQRYYQWDLGFLTDYIVNNHHGYVRSALPQLREHLEKVVRVHSGRHPELITVGEEFFQAASELEGHMFKEEQMLFPYIRNLVRAESESLTVPPAPFGTVANPIRMMTIEHERAGDAFATIRDLLDDYTPPDDACTTMRLTYRELEDFERDLHIHVFLENSVLFPRATKLERELGERVAVTV